MSIVSPLLSDSGLYVWHKLSAKNQDGTM